MTAAVTAAAVDLKKAGSAGLVVAGANDVDAQLVAAAINTALGADGSTVKYNGEGLFAGDDVAFDQLVKDMNAGRVSALVLRHQPRVPRRQQGGVPYRTRQGQVQREHGRHGRRNGGTLHGHGP